MRIIEVILRTFENKRLKAIAVVTLDNGRKLRNIKVINVQSEYFVILPSKRSILKDIGKRGLDRIFYRIVREHVLTEFICLMAKTGPLACQSKTLNTNGGSV